MAAPDLSELQALSAVVRHRSFRRASEEIGVSRSALSHTIAALERRLGVRLLNRTTRSVAPTEAGGALLERIGPLLAELHAALDDVTGTRGAVSGRLRINCGEPAAELLLRTVAGDFLARHPDVSLDLSTDGRFVDIVAEGFDAGVRLREAVPQDMIAVPFGGPVRFLALASPAYLDANGRPASPHDLSRHRCIRLRLPSGRPYRWEFERRGQEMTVEVPGVLTLDHPRLMLQAAEDGLGIAYVMDTLAREALAAGRLVALMEDWCPPVDGLCLYYPGRRHVPAALRAFIEALRVAERAR